MAAQRYQAVLAVISNGLSMSGCGTRRTAPQHILQSMTWPR